MAETSYNWPDLLTRLHATADSGYMISAVTDSSDSWPKLI